MLEAHRDGDLPVLATVDWNMPVMNGLRVRAGRAQGRRTARPHADDGDHRGRAGPDRAGPGRRGPRVPDQAVLRRGVRRQARLLGLTPRRGGHERRGPGVAGHARRPPPPRRGGAHRLPPHRCAFRAGRSCPRRAGRRRRPGARLRQRPRRLGRLDHARGVPRRGPRPHRPDAARRRRDRRTSATPWASWSTCSAATSRACSSTASVLGLPEVSVGDLTDHPTSRSAGPSSGGPTTPSTYVCGAPTRASRELKTETGDTTP